MTKKEIIKYIKNTPENFNSRIFSGMFDEYTDTMANFYNTSNLTKVHPYLYKIHYDTVDYSIGKEYVNDYMYDGGKCSSLRHENWYGRNYDWTYDNAVTFIIDTPAYKDRHASIGVGALPFLTKQFVESKQWHEAYLVLPNLMLDGINDCGVSCNTNVVPRGDKGYTTGTHIGKPTFNGFQLVRYILDHATSADNAIELLDELNIWMPSTKNFHDELHLMINDLEKTYVVEFLYNEMKVYENNIMTNFYMEDITDDRTKLSPFGMGLERYQILKSKQYNIDSKFNMIQVMQSVKFSNAYQATTNPRWYTDFTGTYNGKSYTNQLPTSEFDPLIQKQIDQWPHRNRDKGDFWQTVHTSVYDIANKELNILVQEENSVYTFTL